jgi:hypothetical protein
MCYPAPMLAARHRVGFAQGVCGLKAADYAHRASAWRGPLGFNPPYELRKNNSLAR